MATSPLPGLEEAFTACFDTASNKIDTQKYVKAVRDISKIYDALFMGVVAGQLKSDIMNSAGQIEKVFLKQPEKGQTIEGIVEYELQTRGRETVRADRTSGVLGVLWSKRAISFIAMYLELLATRDDLTASKCAQQTYETVLMKYHGWFTSNAISMAMKLAPSREDILNKLGLKGDAKEVLAHFLSILRPVLAETNRLLAEHDCDFPDKV